MSTMTTRGPKVQETYLEKGVSSKTKEKERTRQKCNL